MSIKDILALCNSGEANKVSSMALIATKGTLDNGSAQQPFYHVR
jgi:hypothetical protein